MKREEMQVLIDSWKKLTPQEQTSLASYVNIQGETAAAFGIAFQRAKKDFQEASAAAQRNARTNASTGKVTAPNPLA